MKKVRRCIVCSCKLRPRARLYCRKCYRQKILEMNRERCRLRYKANPQDQLSRQKIRMANPEIRKRYYANRRKSRLAIKTETINAYGGKCLCCGETEIKFLTLDHSNRDGHLRRAEIRPVNKHTMTGVQFYRKLRKLGFPKTLGLVVQCYNCHMAKDQYGQCPHNEEKENDCTYRGIQRQQDLEHPEE